MADNQSQEPVWVSRRKRRSDLPYEEIETEGEKLLKDLAKKQLDTNVTLKGELKKKKQFTQSTLYEPLSAGVSGILTLDNFQDIKDKDVKIDVLRNYGLDDDEINLKLLSENGKLETQKSGSKKLCTDPLIIQAKLDAIDRKIHEKDMQLKNSSTSFGGAKQMSRHEMDLEKAISHDREKSGLLSILMTDKTENSEYDGDNSRSNVAQLLHEIESRVESEPTSENNTFENSPQENHEMTSAFSQLKNCDLYKSSGCDDCDKLMMMDRYFVGPLLKSEYDYYEKCDTCKQLQYKEKEKSKLISYPKTEEVVSNKKKQTKKAKIKSEVFEMKQVEAIPKDVIVKYRLNEEQIKENPRFSDYSPGQPNKVLFVKNLSNKVTIEDLMSLFIHFQGQTNGKITLRLLTGKMKGQAFVHFEDEIVAKEALELVNGYNFKGKPIVIQYGKKDPV